MDFLKQLQDILGEKRTNIKFNGKNTDAYPSPIKSLRFCEAVITSIESPMILHQEDIDCKGAQRAFWFIKNDNILASQVSEETGIPMKFISNALNEIPVADFPILNILLGIDKKFDVTIAFVRPDKVMRLIFLYAKHFEERPIISPYFFMSVCANIAIQTYLTQKICISFGCPESRKHEGISENEVIVGIPNSMLTPEVF
jgi:uncharacterized protein (DUF169 family)